MDLDLAQFNLKQDQELSYSVRVTDTKNDSSFSTPNPDAASRKTQLAETPSAPSQSQPNTAANQRTEETERTEGSNQPQPNTAANQSQTNTVANQSRTNTASNESAIRNPQSAMTEAKSPDGQNQTSPPQANQNHIAMASPNSNSGSNSTPSFPSSQPPPNSMSKRVLDVPGPDFQRPADAH